MTPAARVQTAIELLDRIVAGAPAEKTLTAWARNSRFAGSKDRAAVRDHVYDVLRCKNTCATLGGGQDGRALMIGLLRFHQVDLSTIFTGANYAPSSLTDAETADRQLEAVVDLPDWAVPKAKAVFSAQFVEIEALMKQRAPVILRANLQKTTRADVIDLLALDGITAEPHKASASALSVVDGARKVKNSRAYQTGEVELQDASSQAAIDLLPLESCTTVLDYCAGGGGKVLAMAGRQKAKYFAHDAIEARLRDLPVRAKRAGVPITTISGKDLAQQTPFDLVFCDVPCSGSGTWRRDPAGKWALQQQDLNDLLELQAKILREASAYVANGGYLGFATCSYFEEENEQQIERFLAENKGWKTVYQKRWSHLDDCDGFFTALLQKES